MKKPIRTPLSAEQLADASRLNDIYKIRAKESRASGKQPPLTQTEVGEQCEWKSPQSTVSQYLTGKVALNLQALIKLAQVLDFEPAEVSPTLAAGIKRSASSKQEEAVGPEVSPLPGGSDIDSDMDDRYSFIPQYTAKAAAGEGHDNPHVEIRSTLAFKKEWLRTKGLNKKNLKVIYADGDSMWPTVSDHDVLLVDESRNEPTDGAVYVLASADKGVIVKRLIKTALGSWILRSDNEDKDVYPDQVLSRNEINEHRIVGRVVWRGGDL